MSNFLKRRSNLGQQQPSVRPRSSVHSAGHMSSELVPYASHPPAPHDKSQTQVEQVQHVEVLSAHTSDISFVSQSQSSLLSGMRGMVGGAVEVTMSSSTVIYDGERTYVEAEEQQLRGGRWEQQRMEGVWEGDQSREAIQRLSRQSRARKVIGQRPLPRAKKW